MHPSKQILVDLTTVYNIIARARAELSRGMIARPPLTRRARYILE